MEITVEANIKAPKGRVWKAWTDQDSIVKWNFASPDWRCPRAELDLKAGGGFIYRMEAKDGSFGFDLKGEFDEIKEHEEIKYHLDDGRKCSVRFTEDGDQTHVAQTFEAETENSEEMQRQGWQAILDNFKAYVESI